MGIVLVGAPVVVHIVVGTTGGGVTQGSEGSMQVLQAVTVTVTSGQGDVGAGHGTQMPL
jgi:hypothetical protein